MAIDVLFLLFIVLAIYKGLKRGFIIAVLSAIALIIGVAAAIKLSALVAGYGRTHMHLTSRWLVVLAFVLVFLAVVIGVRALALLMEKMVDLTLMGWVNKLAGVVLYAVVYTIVLSVLLFYAKEVHLLSPQTMSASVVYPFIRPWGPVVIDEFGKFVPWFKGMFAQLEEFFGRLGHEL